LSAGAGSGAIPVATLPKDDTDHFKTLLPWKADGPNVKKTASGLQYVVIASGDPKGPKPAEGDEVDVQYDGRIAKDGTPFDATTGDETRQFRVGEVIPGWNEALALMVPGDVWMLYIPSNIAYGPGGRGPIPPNADLMFLVKLKTFSKPKTADEAMWAKTIPWPAGCARSIGKDIQYIVLKSGPAGEASPGENDMASIYFDVRLSDGTEMGGNVAEGAPANAPMSQIDRALPGAADALKAMKPGDRWLLRIPPEIAFKNPNPSLPLKFKSPLLVDLELTKVMRMPEQPQLPPGISLPPQ
jgi:FKBP-type peptidyl-prolyl cis-trans isomerase